MLVRNAAIYFVSNRFSIALMQSANSVAGFFQNHFAGTDNLRVVSIILLLLAFVLFLFLVVILYIKSLLNFIRAESGNLINSRQNNLSIADDLSAERDLEKELAKELEISEQKQAETLRKRKLLHEEQVRRKVTDAESELKKRSKNKANIRIGKIQDISEATGTFTDLRTAEKPFLHARAQHYQEFDWNNKNHPELDELSAGIIPFRRPEPTQSLNTMAGIIINMLGRNIDIGKIAQIVKFKCGESATEDEVIQLIDSIRNFISLCNSQKFYNLPDINSLPTTEEALYDLAQNNSTYCLKLLQSLTNMAIDRSAETKIAQKRDLSLIEASNYICTLGTLSLFYEPRMQKNAYEMAIELSQKNVNAWCRVGDIYADEAADSRAIWAYQRVLELGDENRHAHQIANANKRLAQYYYDQGDTAKATKLYNIGIDYYDSIGINRSLTNQEKDIIRIIESKQAEDLPETVNRLLKISPHRQRGYS